MNEDFGGGRGGHTQNEDADIMDISPSEELEALRKETFLALFNLWQVAKHHEEALQKIESMMHKIMEQMLQNPPRTVAKPQQQVATPVAQQSDTDESGIPIWVAIAGGIVLVLVLVVIIAIAI
jgi:hypothetical protein